MLINKFIISKSGCAYLIGLLIIAQSSNRFYQPNRYLKKHKFLSRRCENIQTNFNQTYFSVKSISKTRFGGFIMINPGQCGLIASLLSKNTKSVAKWSWACNINQTCMKVQNCPYTKQLLKDARTTNDAKEKEK